MPNTEQRCTLLPDGSAISFTQLVIVIAYFSYFPQLYKFIKSKTSAGISPYYLLFGCIGSISNLFNMLSLNYWVVGCCKAEGPYTCYALGLGILLVLVLAVQNFAVFSFYMIYFPKDKMYQNHSTLPNFAPTACDSINSQNYISFSCSAKKPKAAKKSNEYKKSVMIFMAVIAYVFVCTIILLNLLLIKNKGMIRLFAWSLGMLSVFTTCIQCMPQIIKTIKDRKTGSISIPMMLIQIPLGYVIVYDIASKRGSSPSSWMSIFLSTTFQVVLLSLCMCYSFLESRRKKVMKRQPRKTDTSPLLR